MISRCAHNRAYGREEACTRQSVTMERGRHTTERTDERRCTRTRQSVTMDGGRHTTERADERRHAHSRRNDGRGMHTTGGSAEGGGDRACKRERFVQQRNDGTRQACGRACRREEACKQQSATTGGVCTRLERSGDGRTQDLNNNARSVAAHDRWCKCGHA